MLFINLIQNYSKHMFITCQYLFCFYLMIARESLFHCLPAYWLKADSDRSPIPLCVWRLFLEELYEMVLRFSETNVTKRYITVYCLCNARSIRRCHGCRHIRFMEVTADWPHKTGQTRQGRQCRLPCMQVIFLAITRQTRL